jgi:hypothetical protein
MKHQSDPRVKIISFRWRGIQKLGEGKRLARLKRGLDDQAPSAACRAFS